jgi:hypothetical protein
MRIKRQAAGPSPFEIANSPAVSGMGGFTATGALIGSAFGPVGLAAGAGIGAFADIMCSIFCRKYYKYGNYFLLNVQRSFYLLIRYKCKHFVA